MRHWPRRELICDATDVPVFADLEKGFGDAPEIVSETIVGGGGWARRLLD
jgi:2-methylisocitrate lyase-like PEP mutase family enzyme